MPNRALHVRAAWDDEAQVWYVAESDLPGLNAEGETLEQLHRKLQTLIPELVVLNRHLIDWAPDGDLPIHVMAERSETLRIPS